MLEAGGRSLHRVYLRDRPADAGWVELDPANSHHVREVLRLRPGQHLRALVPAGHDLVLQITDTRPGRVLCTVAGRVALPSEPALRVSVYQGLTRGERFEYVLQKCTEIGAYDFFPVIMRRTVIRPSQHGAASRLARWQRIVEEAALQSGRAAIPLVHPPALLGDVLATDHRSAQASEGALRLVADEEESRPLGEVLAALREPDCPGRAQIVIGPEGGLERDEVQAMIRAGFVPVSLGPRVLRTETAGPVLLSILLYELADLGGRRE